MNFIFDSHRPFHHNNLIDNLRKIYIIHDGCSSFDRYPTAEDIQLLEELQDDDEDEEEEDDYGQDDDEEDEEIKEELEDLKDNSDDDEDVYGGDKVSKSKEKNGEDEDDEIIGADDDIDGFKVGVKRGRTEGDQVMDRR